MTHPTDAVLRLGLIAERLRNPAALLRGPIVDELRAMFRDIFLSEGRALETPWAPLKTVTILRKLMRGAGYGHILRDTDTLFAALTERGAPHAFARLTGNDTVTVGADVVYARYHRTGTRWMQRRDMVPSDHNWPAKTVRNLLTLVKAHITLGDAD